MDYYIFEKLNSLVGKLSFLDSLAVFFAEHLGYVLVVFIFILFFKNREKYNNLLIKSFSAAILSRFIITEIIRLFWERPRPFAENSVNLLLNHSASPSFPSGHAAFYFGLSFVVYLYNKKAGIWFLMASFLIGLARVYSGIHWPSDVLAGALVGIISAYLINAISNKFSLFKE